MMTRFPRKRIKKCCLDRVCAVCDKYNTWDLGMISTEGQVLWRPRCKYTGQPIVIIDDGWEVQDR